MLERHGGEHHDRVAGAWSYTTSAVAALLTTPLIGGNRFRAIGTTQRLEEDLGRPIPTANQLTFWQALRLVGVRAPVVGYGQLLSRELPIQ
jgi:maleate cis-trans isomerase